MTGRIVLAPALAFGLALGCAAQQDEAMSREGVEDEARFAEAPAEPSATPTAEAAKSEDEPAPAPARELQNLGDVERELAANEAKLRALGVKLRAGGADEDEAGEERKTESTSTRRDRKDGPKKKPSSQGAPQPTAPGDSAPAGGGGSGKGTMPKQDSIAGGALDDVTQPDAAKATPLSPNSQQQDAATRCMSICDLSQITCELSAQVCELAERHTEEEDYRAACERAAQDCDVAQEACNECR